MNFRGSTQQDDVTITLGPSLTKLNISKIVPLGCNVEIRMGKVTWSYLLHQTNTKQSLQIRIDSSERRERKYYCIIWID